MSNWMERRKEAVARAPYNVTEIFIKEAKGAIIRDINDREYIDFAGGIGVQNVGHCHPKVVAAIQQQAATFIHPCFHVTPYESYVLLAEKLNELTPGDFPKKTIFLNSGAEAVENAVKIARKYTGRPAIVSFTGGYHGRTLLTMSLTSKVMPYKKGFGPFAPEVYKFPYPYYYRANEQTIDEVDNQLIESLKQFFVAEVAPDHVAAIIIEPVQGEGGFVVPSAKFMQAIRRICDEYGIVMIADEIQTGFARTGRLFAMEHFGVAPDLMTLSKSMGAGVPISAVVGRREMMDAPEVGQLGGTFSGSPLACAAALAVLDVIEEEQLVVRARRLGEKMMALLTEMKQQFDIIGDVRGLGAMCAIELVTDRNQKTPAKEQTAYIVSQAWKRGAIFLSAGLYSNVVRFLPPLVMTDEQLERGFSVLRDLLAEVQQKVVE
ncbi:4-aminobutyrate--2-oxoglutarate transaminase [Anoxybacillus sp. LAT_35]|uniref:4-aminobutyrate--2-oxoglutarate transaminase n=1 Tax=unclassified Anoxybacillus TaxID=2639704 RepID=UPI001EDADD7D|nr:MULTISPECIES: 4-aminobutyrate--2-oxoglutarate transaminase [unclassified Anoxybacillus]MCG5026301.1 4-aminobutyrate--2-oxoglutarate transaminase [Anoxybacillus flavithermus]MCG6196377.1 4-aminobutyrate--2-oxoglutarate transaminase [Anoxybacillus sp. LAT_38]MCG3082980.1 4-aminobutyrate--2-oxoglutarate transaminase [Anoxybacillus sp. LAT27]MCG3084300.1 4-aminobutyrate--2-oxoglutarate transaminase [Anoxybacillus sp. LAT27]MCG6170972.1 4-aminobutyrate--2-oxoglutarate transaminase [Anoxybacillus